MALIILIDKIIAAIDKGEIVLGTFIDLKKAFDTVNHEILLGKLYKYGIRGIAHQWLKDYLNERCQYVSYNYSESDRMKVACGVPQGSILGPLLFLLYINDMSNVSNLLLPIIFADDTNIFLSGKSSDEIIGVMNVELCKIVEWLNANKLSLNVDKTHYLIFRSKNIRINTNGRVIINGTEIEQQDHTKFLGVTLDSKLTWQKHICKVKGKIAKGIGIINKAKKYLKISSLKVLYYSLVYPHLTYCNEVWGNAADTHISSLFILQKKIVRIMKCAHYRAPSDAVFQQVKVLKLRQIFLQNVLMFMFRFMKESLPAIFDDFFCVN